MSENENLHAYEEYRRRQSRQVHPDGNFDNGGRWYPSDEEKQSCCSRIRSPSRRFPYSLLTHCRTMRHVAKLYGVKESELRELARQENEPQREGGDDYYKVVAKTEDGRLVSIFDGETEYKIDVEMVERARQDHNGGFYCYAEKEQAKRAGFPSESKAKRLPRVLLRVRAEGQYCRYESDKLSFSRITPLEIVEEL